MSNTILSVILALVVGVGIGWVAKPAGKGEEQSGAEAASPGGEKHGAAGAPRSPSAPPPSASNKSGPRPQQGDENDLPWNAPAPGEGAGAFGGVFDEQTPEERERIRAEFAKQFKDDHEDRIASLATELKLTPQQQGRLREVYFAELLQRKLAMFHPQDGSEFPSETPGLGEILGELLTDEQAAAYEELRSRHRRQVVESVTLRSLADLTHLGLAREQQDQIYELLFKETEAAMIESERAAAEVDSGAAAGALVGAIIGNNVGDGEAARGALIGGAIGISGEEIMAQAEQARREQIEREIARFQDILTPQQTERYRATLRREVRGFVYSVFGPDLPPLVR